MEKKMVMVCKPGLILNKDMEEVGLIIPIMEKENGLMLKE